MKFKMFYEILNASHLMQLNNLINNFKVSSVHGGLSSREVWLFIWLIEKNHIVI